MNERELNEVKKQLKEINSIIDISSSPFKLVYAAQNFWRFFLYAGIFSVLLPIFYQLILIVFGSYPSSPYYIKVIFIASAIASWFVLMVIRTRISIRTLTTLNIQGGVLKQILSTKLWIAIIPVIIFAVAIPVRLLEHFGPGEYIPYIGAAIGLILNIIGMMIHEKEYSIAGYWMILVGLALLLWSKVPGYIAFGIIFAPACFLFAGITLKEIRQKRRKND
jgi:hypothetical protein